MKTIIILIMVLTLAASAFAAFRFSGQCVQLECAICNKLITRWVEDSSPFSGPGFVGGSTCITYCDANGMCHTSQSQEIRPRGVYVCEECFGKYGKVFDELFDKKLKALQKDNEALRSYNKNLNKEIARKKLEKQRNELDEQIRGLK